MRAHRRRLAYESLVVVGGAVLAAFVLLQLWNVDLSVPFDGGADSKFYAAVTKTLDERGWYLDNPATGWPFGSQLYDLPMGENLQFALLKGFTLLTGWAEALNLTFLVGFPIVAVTAFWVARHFARFRFSTSVFIALLYAFLPFHFARGIAHLTLANYAAVPIGCMLVIVAATRATPWPPWRIPRRTLVIGLALCALLGSLTTYYAFFTALLVVAAGVLAALAAGDWRRLATAGAIAATIGVVVALNLLPSFAYWAANGSNQLGDRPVKDSEQFGLRLSHLVFPTDDHRIPALATAAEKARIEVAAPTEHGSALGVVGTAGFALALASLFLRAVPRDGPEPDTRPPEPVPNGPRTVVPLPVLGAAIVATLLFGLAGGFGHVLALFGFTFIRGWNRVSVFVAFFALLAAGHAIEWADGRLRARGVPARATAAALTVVAVIGLLDEAPADPFPRSQAGVQRDFAADARLVADIEDQLGHDARLFQFPIVKYPEQGQVEAMPDYDHFRGYLHSDSLRWSYGATNLREGLWLDDVATLPPVSQLIALAAVGFDGLWVNPVGIPDRGEALESALAPHIGPFRYDRDAGIAVADIRAFADRTEEQLGAATVEEIRTAALNPLLDQWGPGFGGFERDAGVITSPALSPAAQLTIENDSDRERRAFLRFEVSEAPEDVTVSWSGGSRTVQAAPEGSSPATIEISVPPGTTTVTFEAPASAMHRLPDGRRVAFFVRDPLVTDAVLITSASRVDPGRS